MFNENRGANRGEWSEPFVIFLVQGNYMPLILN